MSTTLASQEMFEFTPRGLVVHGNPPIEEWLRRFADLRNAHDAVLWCLGDMLNYGEAAYGEKYAQAIELTGYDPDYLRNVAYVARQVDLSLRSDDLRWSHHRVLAAKWIERQDKARIIEQAAKSGMTVQEVRQQVQALPYAPPKPRHGKNSAASVSQDDGLWTAPVDAVQSHHSILPVSASPVEPARLSARVEACYGRQVVLVFDKVPDLREGQRVCLSVEIVR